MSSDLVKLDYTIPGDDFSRVGEASSDVKKVLNRLGVNPRVVKRTAIAMYEAEINSVIHAGGGTANVDIDKNRVTILITDQGPGIPDIELAMREGYSTAPDSVRQMGFGAGMGLPNIKRNADKLEIESEVGKGTRVLITVYLE